MMTNRQTRVTATLRICVVAACPFPHSRGSPVRIQRLANALAERGHDVCVYTYHLGTDSPEDRFEVVRTANVRTYKKLSPGPSLQKLVVVDPLLTAKLRSGLRNRSFDIIHAHHYEGLLAAKIARIGKRIPIVYDAHTMLGSELPYYRFGIPQGLVASIGTRLDSWLPRMADHVVSVTQTIKDKLTLLGMAPDAISVITNGVEHELFAPDLHRAASAHGLPTLIFTGNLASYQGVDHLLNAFAKVLEQRKDVRLLFVTQSSFDAYEEQARTLGIRDQIDFSDAPFVEHPSLLACSDIAVNPRVDADGIPQKLLNYMAAGRATVSFRGSAPCIEHGETGWTVDNGDIDAFASGILMLLDQPEVAASLGHQARSAVLANYTWDIAAERCEALYERLIAADMIGEARNAG